MQTTRLLFAFGIVLFLLFQGCNKKESPAKLVPAPKDSVVDFHSKNCVDSILGDYIGVCSLYHVETVNFGDTTINYNHSGNDTVLISNEWSPGGYFVLSGRNIFQGPQFKFDTSDFFSGSVYGGKIKIFVSNDSIAYVLSTGTTQDGFSYSLYNSFYGRKR